MTFIIVIECLWASKVQPEPTFYDKNKRQSGCHIVMNKVATSPISDMDVDMAADMASDVDNEMTWPVTWMMMWPVT